MEIASHISTFSLQPTSVAYTLLSAALYSLPVERLVEVGISFAEVQVRGASLALQTRQVGLQVASGAFSFVQYLFAGLVTGSGVLYENSGWFFSAIAWAWSCLVTFAFFLCRCCAERRRWLTTLTFPKVKMFGWGAAVVPPVAAGGGLPGAGGPVVGAPVVVAPVGAAVPGAIVAAGGGGGAVPIPIGPPPGDFLLLARGAEWDEVMVTYLLSPTRWLCRTTNADGSAFISALFMPQPGMMRAPVNAGGPRVAPHGVPANSINWICTPPAAAAVWVPGAPELTQVLAEATLMAAALQAHGEPPGYAVFVPGGLAPMQALPGPMAAGGAVAPLMMAPPAAGLPGVGPAGAVLPGGAGAAGAGGALGPAGSSPDGALTMKNMAEAVEALQLELVKMSSQESSSKKKSSSKEKKGHKHKDKKKKKKRKHDSSSGSSSRSRSRSSSSASSSEGPLRWKSKGRKQRVRPKNLMHLEAMKFKKRGDLLAYSMKYPGALSAHFLAGIFSKIHKGLVQHSSQLREVSISAWASQHTGLSETRDLREVANIAAAMDCIQKDEIAQALDILAQRVVSIQSAKKPGGKWEKSEQVELVHPSGAGLASSGMLSLMG